MRECSGAPWRINGSTDQLRGKFHKLGALIDEAEKDWLAFLTFPRAHWCADLQQPVSSARRTSRSGKPLRAGI